MARYVINRKCNGSIGQHFCDLTHSCSLYNEIAHLKELCPQEHFELQKAPLCVNCRRLTKFPFITDHACKKQDHKHQKLNRNHPDFCHKFIHPAKWCPDNVDVYCHTFEEDIS